jgi:hypothetical protein
VISKEMPFFSGMAKPTRLSRMATRNPSLGLTNHIYNRLQAGCYLTIDLNFKDHKKLSGKTSKNSLTHTDPFVEK